MEQTQLTWSLAESKVKVATKIFNPSYWKTKLGYKVKNCIETKFWEFNQWTESSYHGMAQKIK